MSRKKPLTATDPLKALAKAMKRLDPEQGMVARRNARADVAAELRRLKAFVDKEYPVLRSEKKPRKKRTTGLARKRKLRREGLVEASHEDLIAASIAGVRPQHCTYTLGQAGKRHCVMLPRWVAELRRHPDWGPAMAKTAAKNIRQRKAWLMELQMEQEGELAFLVPKAEVK